jgi:DNA gyrase/topoisomerase IV subunit A
VTPSLVIVTRRGLCKKVAAALYPAKGRGTSGVITVQLGPGDRVLAALLLGEGDQLLIAGSGEGREEALCLAVSAIKGTGRESRGSPVLRGEVLCALGLA